jgi:glycerol-3-phosphate dehydrogenase
LRQGQIRVTRESVVERELLMKEATGLVNQLGFWLTTFTGDKMPGWMFGVGLAMYDVLAGKWAHEKHDAAELVARVPPLEGAKVRGGYHYFDAQTDDSRLVLRVLREAVTRGGVAINYVKAKDLLRTSDGRVCGVALEDASGQNGAGSARTIEVKARVVINATGAWADELRSKVNAPKRLRPIRGSHLIFPDAKLPLAQAVSLMHPKDGRAVFAVPWEGVTLVGTTDVDHKQGMWEEPSIAPSEIEYILEVMRHAFPRRDLSLKDARSSYAGVRGVIDTGAADPSKESREHALWVEDGLVTVTGGKLTTFRLMALDTLKAAKKELPETKKLSRGRVFEPTDGTALGKLNPQLSERLLGRHGRDAATIVGMDNLLERVGDTVVLWSELRWAARDEAVVHLDDLLLRRARVGLLAKDGGMTEMDRIRKVAQPELGWDDATWEREEAAYRALWKKSYSF